MGELTPAIQVEGLSFAYEGRPILNEISLEIPQGQFTVLLGKNGSGKSTLMRILGGMLEFESGEVRIMGEELLSFSSRGRAKVLGYLPQHHRPVFPFAVEDVVLTGRASYVSYAPKPEDLEIAVDALRRVGILHLRERPYTELSGGEQQMVRIARVLAQQPRLILLDEPTSHLDFLNSAHLLRLIRELVDADLTVLAVLHDPNSAFLYGDHFIFLKDGARWSACPRPSAPGTRTSSSASTTPAWTRSPTATAPWWCRRVERQGRPGLLPQQQHPPRSFAVPGLQPQEVDPGGGRAPLPVPAVPARPVGPRLAVAPHQPAHFLTPPGSPLSAEPVPPRPARRGSPCRH